MNFCPNLIHLEFNKIWAKIKMKMGDYDENQLSEFYNDNKKVCRGS